VWRGPEIATSETRAQKLPSFLIERYAEKGNCFFVQPSPSSSEPKPSPFRPRISLDTTGPNAFVEVCLPELA
jgi:hypothetical protein